ALIPARPLAGERSPDLVRLLELPVLDQLGKSPQTRCRPPTFIRRSPVPSARFGGPPRRVVPDPPPRPPRPPPPPPPPPPVPPPCRAGSSVTSSTARLRGMASSRPKKSTS